MTDHPEVQIVLALASNRGDSLSFMRAAINSMAPYVNVIQKSPVYNSAPLYLPDQPPFFNATLLGTTKLEPLALLWTLKSIESDVGRMPSYRNGPREIDIDIVFYGDLVLKTPELSIPRPEVEERDFILRSLCDIVPNWVHPQLGKTVSELHALLPDSGMTRLGELL